LKESFQAYAPNFNTPAIDVSDLVIDDTHYDRYHLLYTSSTFHVVSQESMQVTQVVQKNYLKQYTYFVTRIATQAICYVFEEALVCELIELESPFHHWITAQPRSSYVMCYRKIEDNYEGDSRIHIVAPELVYARYKYQFFMQVSAVETALTPVIVVNSRQLMIEYS